jgi:hypothetical protein
MRRDQVRSDEAGAAGDNNHERFLPGRGNRPSAFSTAAHDTIWLFWPDADCFRKPESSRSGSERCRSRTEGAADADEQQVF